MRGLVLFVVLLTIIASFSFVAANLGNANNEKTQTKEKNKELQFSTFTSAVCENKADVVHCKDEVFVNCNGEISKAIDVAECEGFKIDVPKDTGFATFGKEWEDPRS